MKKKVKSCSALLVLALVGFLILPVLTTLFSKEAMAQRPFKLEVLDPRGELFTPPFTPISARLTTLAGKKIGILHNTKPGADAFQPFMEKALKGAFPTIEFKTFVIPYNAYPGKEKDLKALADWSNGVIGLLGD